MKRKESLPMRSGGTLVVAGLCALPVKGGWLIWLPTGLALVVVAIYLCSRCSR